MNTRSYHGLFVSLNEDFSRTVLLSKLWVEIVVGNRKYYLDTNRFGDVVHPDGYSHIREFSLFPYPSFTFQFGKTSIKKEIYWHPSKNSVFVGYTLTGEIPDSMNIIPLIAIRDAGAMNVYRPYEQALTGPLTVTRDGRKINLWTNGTFREKKEWYRNFTYSEEKIRGYGYIEDLYSPGYFEYEKPGQVVVQVSDGEESVDAETAKEQSIKRVISRLSKEVFPVQFQHSSDMFTVGDNIVAGYPWFGSWSRDAFISIPGLLLVKKKFSTARQVLERFRVAFPDGKFLDHLGGRQTPSDSPLWFIYAVKKYMDYTSDRSYLEGVIDYCSLIIRNYLDGYNGISVKDGLVHSPPGSTWMDGNCNGHLETPREGKAVDVNSLWYSALVSLREFHDTLDKPFPEQMSALILTARTEFRKRFLNGDSIKDIADPDDYSIRPNMIFAFSLPYPVLENFRDFKKSIAELVTPFGLRTLSPSDERFAGLYWGDQCSRDRAYHNGSVWPWLIGPYITASVRSGSSKEKLRNYFQTIMRLDYVPEIFDGFLPEEPRGCITQAWSYAEILRAFYEDLS